MFTNMSPSDWAQSIGGLLILIYLLYQIIEKLIGKSKWGQNRKQKKEEAALKQYQKFTQDFVNQFVPPLMDQLNQQDEKLFQKIDQLRTSSNDMLRKEMTDIYYKYLPYKKILQYDKECFLKLYYDYAAQDGNSYIKDVYEELKEWPVVLSKKDLE